MGFFDTPTKKSLLTPDPLGLLPKAPVAPQPTPEVNFFTGKSVGDLTGIHNALPKIGIGDANAAKADTIAAIPFTDKAKEIINNNTNISYNMNLGADKPVAERTEFTPGKLPGKDVVTNIQIGKDTAPANTSHEIFHTLFFQNGIEATSFNKAWESAKKNNPDMQALDDKLFDPKNHQAYNNGSESVINNPHDLATERFSSLGSLWGNDGLSALPKELQPYYKDILNDKAAEPDSVEGNFFTGEPTHVPEGLKPGQSFTVNGKTYVVSAPQPKSVQELGDNLYDAVNGKPSPSDLSVASPKTKTSTTPAILNAPDIKVKEPFSGVYQKTGMDIPDTFNAPGGPVVGSIIKAGVEFPERVAQTIADLWNQSFTGEIKDKAVFTDKQNRLNTGLTEAGDMYNKMTQEGASDPLAKATATLYGVSSTILDLAPLVEAGARGVLAASGFDRELNGALYRLGMSPQDFSIEQWAKNTRTASLKIAQAGDVSAGRQLVEDYKTISKSLRVPSAEVGKTADGLSVFELADQNGMEHANTKGVVKFAQDVSNKILEPLSGKGATFNLARPAEESLPGYRSRPGQAPAMGLSTEEIQPVGFEGSPSGVAPQENILHTEISKGLVGKTIEAGAAIDMLKNAYPKMSAADLTSIISEAGKIAKKGNPNDVATYLSEKLDQPVASLETSPASPSDTKSDNFLYRESSPNEALSLNLGGTGSKITSRDINLALGQGRNKNGIIIKIQNGDHLYTSGAGNEVSVGNLKSSDIVSVILPENALTKPYTLGDVKSTPAILKSQLEAQGFDVSKAKSVDAGVVRGEIKYVEIPKKIKGGNTSFTKDINNGNVNAHGNETSNTSPALGDIRQGHGKLAAFLSQLRIQGIGEALRRGAIPEGFKRFVDRPRELGGYFETHFGREDLRLDPKRTSEEIDAASAALLNMIGKNNYTIDSYVDNIVSIYESAGMPELTGAEIRKFFAILPESVKKQFGGIFTTDVTSAIGALRTNADATFDLVLNPKYFDDKRFTSGSIALHELYGHVTYGFSDDDFKSAIRSGMNSLVVKNSELAKTIFLAGADTDFEALMRAYHADSVENVRRVIESGIKAKRGEEAALTQKILEQAGLVDADNKPFLQGSTVQHFFINADLIKEDLLQAFKTDFKELLTPDIEKFLSAPSSALANEFFARLIEYTGTHGMERLDFLKDSTLYEVASRAAARSTALFSNALENADPEAVLIYSLKEPGGGLPEKVDQIKTELAILEESIANDPAKSLSKFANKNGELPEVLGYGGKFATSGDEIASVGFTDSEEARAAYSSYRMKLKQVESLKTTLRLAKEALKRSQMAEADEKALDRFLNKAANNTEGEARRERVRQAIERGERAAANAEEYRQKFNRLIEEMRKKDIEKLSIMGQFKQTFFPLKTIDNETKGILQAWQRKLLAGEQLANKQYQDLAIPGIEGVQTFVQFEGGESNAYYNKIRGIFRDMLRESRMRDLDVDDRGPNYIPHVYAESPEEIQKSIARYLADRGMDPDTIQSYIKGEELPKELQRRLSLHPFFEKTRTIPSYATALQYGLTPKFKSVGQLVAYYREQMERTIANQELLSDLIQRAKIMPLEIAPTSWQPVNLAFSTKGYYAEDKLAKILNNIFAADREPTLGEKVWHVVAKFSKFWQDIALSGGVPKTALNSFSYALSLRSFTTALGHLAFLEPKAALSELNAAGAFLRASGLKSDTAKFFTDNHVYLLKMAEQGINLGDYVGSYMKPYFFSWSDGTNISSQEKWLKSRFVRVLSNRIGVVWDKTTNEKTFSSMLPMMYTIQFKSVYNKLIRSGYSATDAAKVAGDTVKNFNGIADSLGRSPSVQDAMTAIFFAPRYRETVLKSLVQTGKAGLEMAWNIGGARKPLTKSLEKNRRLFFGLALMLGFYELLNRKLNDGKGMTDNEENHKLDLRIPTPDGGAIYIGFMPSYFTLVRAGGNALFDLSQGDIKGAEQAVGVAFSMPLKTATEVWTNQDYFGRPIYKDTDDGKTKAELIASYVGLSISHPFVKEAVKWLTTAPEDKNLWKSISAAIELPLKFSSATQIAKAKFYDAMDLKTQQNAAAKRKVQPIFDHVKELYAAGQKDEAEVIFNGLSDDDKAIFKNIASSLKTKTTQANEAKIYPIVLKVRDLYKAGKKEEAAKIYDELNTEEKRIFKLAAAKLPKE